MPRSPGKFLKLRCDECNGTTHSTPEMDDSLRPCVNTLKRKVDRLEKTIKELRKNK